MLPRKRGGPMPLESIARAIAVAILDGRLSADGLEYGWNNISGRPSATDPIKLTLVGDVAGIVEMLGG